MNEKFVLALDQGTTSSRAIVYDLQGSERRVASRELKVIFPQDGWVEQDPEEIWRSQWEAMQEAAQGFEDKILAIGITNQRETTIAWDRESGKALAPAIVWQCRRSAPICDELKSHGLEPIIRERTGLVVDSYFSATKIAWLMRNIDGLKERVARKEVVFGTVDAWLLFKLTACQTLATDYTNASRTMLLNIEHDTWDEELLGFFELHPENLPLLKASNGDFGSTSLLGPNIPIRAVLGDQQASLFGHECWEPGAGKCTFGTGAFLLVNCGTQRTTSSSGLLSTVAWQIEKAPRCFALEGSVFVAGSLVQWMRDKLKFFTEAKDVEKLAASVSNSGGVLLIPAFVGLGAPYWSENVRGAMFGLTRDTSPAHLARAGLEAVCQQVADLLDLPELRSVRRLRIDGGMARNELFCQSLADYCKITIEPAPSSEVTAKGVGALAAAGASFGGDLNAMRASFFSTSAVSNSFSPINDLALERKRWKHAMEALLNMSGSV